ncbi:MAG: methylated-DNA--[protein]-cysteine S-methyltransferase [Eggerthella lenta]
MARTLLRRRRPGALPPVNPRHRVPQRVGAARRDPVRPMTTYGWIARRIEEQTGARTSARAVGSAVGRNPISIILPCHRVVGRPAVSPATPAA